MIKIRYYIIILSLIALSWVVTLKLTQQRIQLEALNSLANVDQRITPFQWNFIDHERDLVESSKKDWISNKNNSSIIRNANSDTQLSLNFSSEVINSDLFNTLIIKFKNKVSTKVKIQFKTRINDDYFYYSPAIVLNKIKNEINLNLIDWQGISIKGQPALHTNWGADKHKVSSLVFSFYNTDEPLEIESIALPFDANKLKLDKSKVGCYGNILGQSNINLQSVNLLELSEICYLPSNYMWLKSSLHDKFPGSILILKDTDVMAETSLHRVNKSYINVLTLNLMFYALLIFLLLAIFALRRNYENINNLMLNSFSFFDLSNVFKAYAVVLIPSLLIFIGMYFYKPSTLDTFKIWPYYFLWAVVQQIFLVYLLSEKIFYSKIQNKLLSSLLAALVFASLHLPSVTLFLLTFLAGTFWSYIWLKYKKIIPLALSHSVLALMLYHVVPDYILYSAKVFHWFWE